VMASIPVQPTPNRLTPEAVERELRRLEAVWDAETAHLSAVDEIVNHPAFRQIVGLGEPVVPFLLRALERAPGLWVWALPEITGANPVPAADRGNLARMSETWLRWAK